MIWIADCRNLSKTVPMIGSGFFLEVGFPRLSPGDGFSGTEFGDEELSGRGGGFALGDGEDVSDDGAGEVGGIGEVMAGLWEEVFEPGFGGDCDE